MGDRHTDHLAGVVAARERRVGALDAQMHVAADEFQPRIAHQDARQQAGLAQDLIDIEYESEIVQVAPKCSYDRDGRITTVTTLSLIATRGPAAQSNDANFIFVVAVVDQNQHVLARERFESTLQFARSQRRAGVEEEIEEVIPLAAGLSGANYEILVGFELSQDQLDFNRDRRRR